jgi:hypothetical protein
LTYWEILNKKQTKNKQKTNRCLKMSLEMN